MADLRAALDGHDGSGVRSRGEATVVATRQEIAGDLSPSERQHAIVLDALRTCVPEGAVFAGDVCQLVYTGAFAFPVRATRGWLYPAGYCALGCALPNAIGAMKRGPVIRLSPWRATAASCSPCPN